MPLLVHQNRTKTLTQQLRTYDDCFTEFLNPGANGQKHMQSILLREAFKRFNEKGTGIQEDKPTSILDVSCGPGGYSTAWTSQISKFLPHGMEFHCTDFKGGRCEDGTPYPQATARAIEQAAQKGDVKLAGKAYGVEADLFSGTDPIITEGKSAHITHWSHSGYHVRDALGDAKNDPQAIEAGLNTAVDKIYASLNDKGLLFSIHQTGDVSDNIPSEMFPNAHRFTGVLDDVPQRIEARIKEKSGYVSHVNFASPLEFPTLSKDQWESLKNPKAWDYLSSEQGRALRLLSFIAYDFSDAHQSGLEKLAEQGKLGEFIDQYRGIVERNGGFVNVKCAFQMAAKSPEVGQQLSEIASELNANMPQYLNEMRGEMRRSRIEK